MKAYVEGPKTHSSITLLKTKLNEHIFEQWTLTVHRVASSNRIIHRLLHPPAYIIWLVPCNHHDIYCLYQSAYVKLSAFKAFFTPPVFLQASGVWIFDFGSPLMARIRLTARMATLNSSKALEREEHALDSVVVGLYRQFMRWWRQRLSRGNRRLTKLL